MLLLDILMFRRLWTIRSEVESSEYNNLNWLLFRNITISKPVPAYRLGSHPSHGGVEYFNAMCDR